MKRSSSAGLGLLRSQGGSEKVPHLVSVSLCGSSSVLVESDLSGFLPEKTPPGASIPPGRVCAGSVHLCQMCAS